MKEGFHSLELNHATWEVPQKYSKLAGIGAGAYGQVNHRLCQYQNTTILSDLQLHLGKGSFNSPRQKSGLVHKGGGGGFPSPDLK